MSIARQVRSALRAKSDAVRKRLPKAAREPGDLRTALTTYDERSDAVAAALATFDGSPETALKCADAFVKFATCTPVMQMAALRALAEASMPAG